MVVITIPRNVSGEVVLPQQGHRVLTWEPLAQPDEELLGVAPDLGACSRPYVLLNLLPTLAEELQP